MVRKFLNKTCLIIIGLIIFSFLSGMFTTKIFSGNNYQTLLNKTISEYSEGKSVVKIDEQSIGKDYLDKRVKLYKKYILRKSNSPDVILKDKILKKMIDNLIVLNECKNTKIFKSEKARDYLWIFLEEAMINYYLDFMVEIKNKKSLTLTDKQIENFYNKNKKLFDAKKINKSKAYEVIKKQLLNIDEKLKNKHRIMLRKIELGKLKRKKKIKVLK